MQIKSIPAAPRTIPGYIYLLGSRKFGWYKIGKSREAAIRVVQLGVLLPFKVEVIGVWRTGNMSLCESLMHKKYANKRINGEWFSFTGDEIGKILNLCQPFDMILCPAAENFANLRKDVVIETDPERIKMQRRAKGLVFMDAVREYMALNKIEDTKENRKAAKESVLSKYKLDAGEGTQFLAQNGLI